MNTTVLRELSLVNTSISKTYNAYLEETLSTCLHEERRAQILNIYKAYCYAMGFFQYTAIDILNDSNALNRHFHLLAGFIYSLDNTSLKLRYKYVRELGTLFFHIAKLNQLEIKRLSLSDRRISEDIQGCLEKIDKIEIDESKLDYLNGWSVKSKEGKVIELHLDTLYVTFGVEFTQKIHSAIRDYALKHKATTLQTAAKVLKSLFIGFADVYQEKSGKTIEETLNKNHVQSFFHKVYRVLFARSQASQLCPKNFHKTWAYSVYIYNDCFINTGFFEEPSKPFIIPVWKEPKGKAPTFSIGGNVTSKEKLRWFTQIPLKIKDEEAVSIITERVDRDLQHIKHVCLAKFEELRSREARNKGFAKSGLIKPLTYDLNNATYHNALGMNNLENTVATFYEHGIAAKSNYIKFLRCGGKAKELNFELNLPSSSTLNVLLTLLVIEHPNITPSWLQRWELFDLNGSQVGYKQAGNQYVIVSSKPRKGASKAQQTIVLSDLSKSVVEFLIDHTRFAREHLKKQKNPDWRKMILTATTQNSACCVDLNTTLHAATDFYQWLQDQEFLNNNGRVSLEDARAISEIHSLRSVRRHRGLQIYLETRSMDAVAEGLGHEKKDVRLLTHYLPKPLMDFFNDRWVRQFQNAILLEAMKSSAYCLEAVDMSPGDIDEFLTNHGICNFPNIKEDSSNTIPHKIEHLGDELAFDQITYTISVAVLQVLIAIRSIVESSEELNLLDVVTGWYQSAVFVLDTLNSGRYSGDADLMEMLDVAKNNQLDTSAMKGSLLC